MKNVFFFLAFFAMAFRAPAQKYLFYLHGKIVEDMGLKAYNDAYGTYEYEHILNAFRKEHFVVISEIRKPDTDIREYAGKVARQVDSLVNAGVKPGNITVVGASKGAAIAMVASSEIRRQEVNYVLLSSCNDYMYHGFPELNLCGNILSIYEKSDFGNGSCDKFKIRSRNPIPYFKEISLTTGMKHGYLYKPLPEWVEPAVKWANGNYK